MRLVTAVIVTYNSARDIPGCLKGLRCPVTVVDNNSRDNTLNLLKKSSARVIANKKNLGYARAANQGIREANSKYILLLNPDVRIKEAEICKLSVFMEKNPEADVVAPKLFSSQERMLYSCRRFPSARALVGNTLGIFSDQADSYLMKDYGHEETRQVDWVSGGCMMLRAGMLFDERYFLYMEDVDFCRGKRVYYLPFAVAVHDAAHESRRRPIMLLHHVVSLIRYYMKNG